MSLTSKYLSRVELEIADALCIQTTYQSNFGETVEAGKENFRALVSSLLTEDESGLEDEDLLKLLLEKKSKQILAEHVVGERTNSILVPLNEKFEGSVPSTLDAELSLEDGTVKNVELTLKDGAYALNEDFDYGVHSLEFEFSGLTKQKCLILIAPEKGEELSAKKSWGFFAPLYALNSPRSWGAGDYTDFENFSSYAASLGAETVATLPLLPSFLAEWKDDPSPYSPASRVFWSEFYVDPEKSPEWDEVPEAKVLHDSFKEELDALRGQKLISYKRIFEIKQAVLVPMANFFFDEGDPSRLQALIKEKHDVVQYARFRAYCDVDGIPWSQWPQEWSRDLPPRADVKDLERLYLYMQLLACEQVASIADSAKKQNLDFYLDLPVGVHSDSYDLYKNSKLYARQLSAGAPPDPFFTGGQDWGFPPWNPRTVSSDNLQHFRSIISHHLQHASLLRVDHVMGLHRIYVIPRGFDASQGLYVTYPKELFYGALLLEAMKQEAVIVGEDLGTVPAEVVSSMEKHALARLYVMQYEANPKNEVVLREPVANSVASLNTHDMPMWETFWAKLEPSLKLKISELFTSLKLLGTNEASSAEVLKAGLSWLMNSEARLSLITLEDLWLEPAPQNTPGTYKELPNWRRKMEKSLDEIVSDQDLKNLILEMAKYRN